MYYAGEDINGLLYKECIKMAALEFPCIIFQTKNRMDDYNAKDMRCGDLSEAQLKTHYGLDYISDQVDPWTLNRRSAFDNPRSKFCCNMRPAGEKMTHQQCIAILFDEFRQLSREFALYGPYRHLIEKMITHMQNGNGTPFRDIALDMALKKHIVNDSSQDNSTRILLARTFKEKIDWEKKMLSCRSKRWTSRSHL